jgi:hypothetical protein
MSPTTIPTKADEKNVEVAWTPSTRQRIPGGIAVAALLSAMLGLLTLAVVNVFTAGSTGFNAWVHGVGKLWMPGAAGIGPYSGKETLALIAWLGSWLILHFALRKSDLEISRWFIVFLVGVAIATTLIWPPVFEYLAGHK